MINFRVLFALGVGLFLLVGCSSATPALPTTAPYPGPGEASSGNPPLPTVDSQRGQVKGILRVQKDAGSEPVVNAILYLAPLLKDDKGTETAAAMDRITSPSTVTNAEGVFAFINIAPGGYTLVLDRITNSYALFKPNTQESLIIRVEAGQVVDLGTLTYDSLPLSR